MAAPEPFITVEDLTTYMNEDADNPKGVMVTDAACDICRTKAEQTFTEIDSAETVKLDGSGTEIQLLPEYPVGQVSSVTVNGEALATTEYTIDTVHGSLVRTPNGQGYSLNGTVWPKGRLNVVVKYKHGWPAEDFPSDLRMVALALAERLYHMAGTGNLQSESLGARSVTYKQVAQDLTENELRILSKYKRW